MSEDARAYALRLLGQRSYTTHNLRRKLIQKEFSETEVDETLDRLVDSGVLNDAQFALSFARGKLTGGSASPRRVRQTLSRKGVSVTLSDTAIEQVIQEESIDLRATLEKVAGKKLATLSGLDKHVARRRLYGFLVRRGYNPDEIRTVAEKLMRLSTEAGQ